MSSRQRERYYWLKLTNDFFDNHTLRILRGQDGGHYALLLYIELLAESVTREGRLRCSEKVAYDEAMIGSMFGFSEQQVKQSFALLTKFELMRVEKDGTLVFPDLNEMVGNGTIDAARKRQERAKGGQKEDRKRTDGGQKEDKGRTDGGQKGEKRPLENRDKSIEIREEKEEECVPPARTSEEGGSDGGAGVVPSAVIGFARFSGCKPPTEKQVLDYVSGVNVPVVIPKEFARKWYGECAFMNWRDTQGKNIASCWRNKLLYAWRDDERQQRERNGGPTDREVQAEKTRAEEADWRYQQKLNDAIWQSEED